MKVLLHKTKYSKFYMSQMKHLLKSKIFSIKFRILETVKTYRISQVMVCGLKDDIVISAKSKKTKQNIIIQKKEIINLCYNNSNVYSNKLKEFRMIHIFPSYIQDVNTKKRLFRVWQML